MECGPPDPPVILGYERGTLLRKGNPKRFSCVSNGGNPLATLTWFKGSQELPSETRHEAGNAIADLDITVSESDNNAEYRCEATNTATLEPLVNATNLSVMFPPAAVKVSSEPREVKANTEATLVCESASSNPKANVTWWREGFEVGPGDSLISSGQFGGFTTTYSVKVNVSADDNGAVYTCQADNHFGTTTHDAITLSILYAPNWVTKPETEIAVTEGSSIEVNVSAQGNPDAVTYLWRRGDEVVRADSFLNISSVTRDQAGTYTVEATNSQGTVAANLTLNIKYGATISSISGGKNLSVGETVTLICQVDANPDPDINWVREGYDFGNTEHKKHVSQNVVEMTLRNVTVEDTGVFVCSAKNEIGDTATADAPWSSSPQTLIGQGGEVSEGGGRGGEGRPPHLQGFGGALCLVHLGKKKEKHPIKPRAFTPASNRYTARNPPKGTAPPTDTPPTEAPNARISSLIIVIVSLVGAALLVLNGALVACFIKRRARKRLTGSPPLTEVERAISRVLADKADLPRVVTLSVSTVGGLLVLINVVLVACVLHRRRRRQGSQDEYEAEAARVTATSTYLIEQLEPPPQYASRPPPHILPPPPSHNDLNMDDPYDDVRRNQYNAALDRATAAGTGGYGTLGRRTATPDHYNIPATDPHYPLPTRYNTYQPPTHAPLTAHSHALTQNNGSLRRNAPSKLHFPKDYIRNGSMNIPVSSTSSPSGGVVGPQYPPVSPTRTHPPPHPPMLSTFAPDAAQSPVGLPMEHRGHLV
ncbi:Nephrin [Chionoecetes opilio]|uniref:Nephrin n=1 Tax=Chionoecetes opilio TaxID=41210 RepID=A0A8J5CP18_CHIOP|nr:Nephrin [Chionoecetes opilio]